MKINNENETNTLHSTYQIFMDTSNEKQKQNTILTCKKTRNMIHENSSRIIYSSIY